MSNYLAIATVTAALQATLANAIAADLIATDAHVTTVRPDNLGSGNYRAGVNIYLYQVTPNTAWRNADLPTRRSDGQGVVQRPQLGLDLQYLLSFYGEESRLEPQRLLGSVVRALQARPVLSREMIQQTVGDEQHHLAGSDLADQVERVKFSPLSLSLEELSKLWSVFFQVKYSCRLPIRVQSS